MNRTIKRGIAGVLVAGLFLAATGAAFAAPSWEPDANARGNVVFYNAAGNVITSGNVSASPIAAYIATTGAARVNDSIATLYGALAQNGVNPGLWPTDQLSGGNSYPVAGAPASVETPNTRGVYQGAAGDLSIANLVTAFPHPASDTGTEVDGVYQIRIVTSGPTNGTDTLYWESDIKVTGNTWTQLFPPPPASNTTSVLAASPASPQPVGTPVNLTDSITPSTATGTVQFKDGATNLGSTVTVSGGSAAMTASGLAVGSHSFTAVFTPGAPAVFNGSTSNTVPYSINPAATSITTRPSPSVPVGHAVSDTATLAGGTNPTGTITFKLYGPGDTTCASSLNTSTATVNGNGTYASGSFTPTTAGTYQWVASYGGDASNSAAAGTCGDTTEQVVVSSLAVPTLSTQASANTTIGGTISDSATLAGGSNPTGAITFKLYGDASCTTLVNTSSATVTGAGTYNSTAFTPPAPGTYNFIASYSGDANNAAVSGTCGAANESVTVSKATPALSTRAATNVPNGLPISDSATLTGGFTPTGTITFNLYSDASCQTLVTTSQATVNGNGTYASANFSNTTPGTYYWVASYSGDANNAAAAGTCGDPTETSVVIVKAQPTLTTSASASVPVGGTIKDTATLAGGISPTGTITFKVYGPGDASCTTALATFTSQVSGNGSYTSNGFMATTAGTYRFVASYSGDANNFAAGPSSCSDPHEQVVVTPQTMTGRAYGADATVAGIHLINASPDTGNISTTSAMSTTTPCVVSLPPGLVISGTLLCANVTTSLGPSKSVATASVKSITIGIPGLPVIQATLIATSSTSTCASESGSTTIASLTVGGVPVDLGSAIAPNTTVPLVLGKIVLNEQISSAGTLTVNGLHLSVPGLADVVLASSTSDIHNCP